jgi:hydrophobic/amphiphilic exporter-1 (mainly G- bacteria), HAE1 family
MQVELRDASFDLAKLQTEVDAVSGNALTQSSIQRVMAPFRSRSPQFTIDIDRVKTEAVHLTADQVFSALSGYLGAAYVDQFNKFGRTFQIYVQADSQFRLRLEDLRNLQTS